jgi:hypothetical protein
MLWPYPTTLPAALASGLRKTGKCTGVKAVIRANAARLLALAIMCGTCNHRQSSPLSANTTSRHARNTDETRSDRHN